MLPLQTKNELKKIILQRIEKKGPISFADFMDLALYHPECGYYQKSASDDYYTSAEVHSIFAELLAHFFYQQWKNHFKKEKEFHLVELGCGDGKLAQRILLWFALRAPDLFSKLRYTGIEKSQARKREAEKILQNWREKIEIHENFSFSDNFINGIVFSNEFFDALPFHRVTMKSGKLKEIFVAGNFEEVFRKPRPEVQKYFEWLKIFPQEETLAEAHPLLRDWMRKIAKSLRRGMVLTIDYGFEAEELYSEIRREGTALCHFQHQTNRNFYENIGSQDITAHVNFTALLKEAEGWGLRSLPLQTQSQFLLENGLEEMLKAMQKEKTAKEQIKLSSAIKSLIHPEGMGSTFKVLLQLKI